METPPDERDERDDTEIDDESSEDKLPAQPTDDDAPLGDTDQHSDSNA
jgi:hypothetical protein